MVCAGASSGFVAGCSVAPQETDVAQAAVAFVTSASTDVERACALLAERTRAELEKASSSDCPQALADAGLAQGTTVRAVTVAGRSAQVVLDDDTVFLAQFDTGWRVVAAGCSPPQDRQDVAAPYDCEVSGG